MGELTVRKPLSSNDNYVRTLFKENGYDYDTIGNIAIVAWIKEMGKFAKLTKCGVACFIEPIDDDRVILMN